MSTLYKIDGTEIDVGGDTPEPTPVESVTEVAECVRGARTNLVQTQAYTNAGTERWLETGLRFKRTKNVTSFAFSYKLNITGGATKVYVMCKGAGKSGTLQVDKDYTSGEQSYSDTFSDDAILDADYIVFYLLIATDYNTDNPTRIATARTLKLDRIPDGLELVGEFATSRCPPLSVDSLTFDEVADFWYKYEPLPSKWCGKTWFAIGDSITQGVPPYYPNLTGRMLSMGYVTNNGRGGSALVQWANDFIEKAHFAGYDLVTIMHGVNDHDNSPNSPIGTLAAHGSTFDKTTFVGAYQYIIEKILNSSPNTEIILLKSTTVSNDNWVNNVGAKMSDYRAATQAVADSYGLDCFDASAVITAENYAQLTRDGIHPTAEGYVVLSKALAEWMAEL